MLVDDGSSAVSLPEVPLLGVLPGTGGLTRVVDKRKVRRDHADVFCTTEEGIKGKRAVEWRLVDEVAEQQARAKVAERARRNSPRALEARRAAQGHRADAAERDHRRRHASATSTCRVEIDRDAAHRDDHRARARSARRPPRRRHDRAGRAVLAAALQVARELDDAILHLRINELEIGTWCSSRRATARRAGLRRVPLANKAHWLVNEIDPASTGSACSSASTSPRAALVALVEPGSCFAGTLAELVFAADRSYMLIGVRGRQPPAADDRAVAMNFGPIR
jgi:benzoyl-CoA-dihydrodiol lyase